MPRYLQSDRTNCGMSSLPVRGIRIRATERNQTLFTVTSVIADSADNLDNLFNNGEMYMRRVLKINFV